MAVAPSALVPTQCPLRGQHRSANNAEVLSDDRFGFLSGKDHVDVTIPASCHLLNADFAAGPIIANPVISGLTKVVVNSNPAILCMLEHVEGVRSIGLLSWKDTIIGRVVNVSVPHWINA